MHDEKAFPIFYSQQQCSRVWTRVRPSPLSSVLYIMVPSCAALSSTYSFSLSPSLFLFLSFARLLCCSVVVPGQNNEKFVPNPQHSSPLALSMLRYVGRLMGLSLRTRLCLPFQFPGMIWKRMLVRQGSLGTFLIP